MRKVINWELAILFLLSLTSFFISTCLMFQRHISISADTVWYQSLLKYVFDYGYSLESLSAPRTLYLFPDVLVHFILYWLLPMEPYMQFTFGFIQIFLLSLSIGYLCYAICGNYRLSTVVALIVFPGYFSIASIYLIRLIPFAHLYMPQYHTCELIGQMICLALILEWLKKQRGSFMLFYLLMTTLSCVSSKIFMANFMATVLVLSFVLTLLKKIKKKYFVAFVSINVLALIFSLSFKWAWDRYVYDLANDFNRGGFNLSRIPDTFLQYMRVINAHLTSDIRVDAYFAWMTLIVFGLNAIIACAIVFGYIKETKNDANRVTIYKIFTLYTALVPFFNIIAVSVYGHYTTWYSAALWRIPWIWLLVSCISFIILSFPSRSSRVIVYSILAALGLFFYFRYPASFSFWRYQIPVVACTDEISAQYDLSHGLSVSNYSAVINTYSKRGVIMIKAYPDLRLRSFESLLDLYFEETPGVAKRAHIDFIIANHISERVINKYSAYVEQSITCERKKRKYTFMILKPNNLGYNKSGEYLSDLSPNNNADVVPKN